MYALYFKQDGRNLLKLIYLFSCFHVQVGFKMWMDCFYHSIFDNIFDYSINHSVVDMENKHVMIFIIFIEILDMGLIWQSISINYQLSCR